MAPETGVAATATVEPWPSATLEPVSPAVMLAPWPRTVALAFPLSLAALPSTVEAAPVAEAPKPPALALAPLDTGCTAVTLLSDTNGPALPVVRLATLVLVANSCDPFTASVEVPERAPGATLCSPTGVPAVDPTSVTLLLGVCGVAAPAAVEYWRGARVCSAVTAPPTLVCVVP